MSCGPFAALGQAAFSGALTTFGGPADSPRSPLARPLSGPGANSPPEDMSALGRLNPVRGCHALGSPLDALTGVGASQSLRLDAYAPLRVLSALGRCAAHSPASRAL